MRINRDIKKPMGPMPVCGSRLLLCCAFLAFGFMSAFAEPVDSGIARVEALQMLKNGQQISLIMMQVSIDGAVGKSSGWPADAKITSRAQLASEFEALTFLSAADIKKLGLLLFEITNIAESDPGETLLLLYEDPKGRFAIAFRKNGEGQTFSNRAAAEAWAKAPVRGPAFLK